ncbi:MAG: 50S ribosomal protein L25 [Candidatus Levybacteria bacterium]|nr:50S ribosomal protein L25 [Candidatus Levybacteria bacterium]
MTKREKLNAEKRIVLGKKVRHLRKEGILPANMFGKGIKSLSVQLPITEFQEVYKKVHETGLVDLAIDGENHPILIQNVHIHPITHTPLHADFFKVNLKEKVKATIPIVAVGEPKAITDKIGVLLQALSEVEVEALPADLPEHIEVNVEKLAQIDENITVADMKVPADVEIMAEPTEMVFRIGELVSEEAEELAAEEEAASEAASEETTATGEGAEPTEGQPAENSETSKEPSEKTE